MYDVAVPMFNMQYLLGAYTPDAQPLILWASGDTEERLEYRMHAQVVGRAGGCVGGVSECGARRGDEDGALSRANGMFGWAVCGECS